MKLGCAHLIIFSKPAAQFVLEIYEDPNPLTNTEQQRGIFLGSVIYV